MGMFVSKPGQLQADTIPTSLFGYDVVEFLGEGAASVIYVVTHPKSKQLYALKYVVRKEDRDDRFIEQLENEYEIGRQLNHLGLRRVIDVQYSRTLFRRITGAALILELFDGLPLDSYRSMPVEKLIPCFIQTAMAIDAMHRRGYAHCDLKPNNILLNAAGEVKIIDLGQACKLGTSKERIQGTPDYIAPEQVRCQPVTVRTDIFNFGATLYWATCNQNLPTLITLKKGSNSFLVDDQIATPRQVNPRIPETLSNLIMECIRTNPQRRPADMGEIVTRLEIIQHGLSRFLSAVSA